jgi:hypothetical protein
MVNGVCMVLKHKAQRIKYKDGIAFGDEYVNRFKKYSKEIIHESIPGGDSYFILCALCFVL